MLCLSLRVSVLTCTYRTRNCPEADTLQPARAIFLSRCEKVVMLAGRLEQGLWCMFTRVLKVLDARTATGKLTTWLVPATPATLLMMVSFGRVHTVARYWKDEIGPHQRVLYFMEHSFAESPRRICLSPVIHVAALVVRARRCLSKA
jgi:hypothetical protein